jgi:hypothetical protein
MHLDAPPTVQLIARRMGIADTTETYSKTLSLESRVSLL